MTNQTNALPSTPSGLSVTSGDAEVTLTWRASPEAAAYSVKRATTAGGSDTPGSCPYTTVVSGVTATSYTDTEVTNGTTYYYVVSSTNACGESANSREATGAPFETVICARCGEKTPEEYATRVKTDGRVLCRACAAAVCADCGSEGSDVMRRAESGWPVLCTVCCGRRPGRTWMLPASEEATEGTDGEDLAESPTKDAPEGRRNAVS